MVLPPFLLPFLNVAVQISRKTIATATRTFIQAKQEDYVKFDDRVSTQLIKLISAVSLLIK